MPEEYENILQTPVKVIIVGVLPDLTIPNG